MNVRIPGPSTRVETPPERLARVLDFDCHDLAALRLMQAVDPTAFLAAVRAREQLIQRLTNQGEA